MSTSPANQPMIVFDISHGFRGQDAITWLYETAAALGVEVTERDGDLVAGCNFGAIRLEARAEAAAGGRP
jgi:hypothetical protein